VEVDREFVERLVNDLRDRHVAELTAIQAEIDRRVAAERHEAELRFTSLDQRFGQLDSAVDRLAGQIAELIPRDDAETVTGQLEKRIGLAEAAIQRQRGRTAAYASAMSVLLVLIALLTLILNHVRLLLSARVRYHRGT